MTQLKAIASAFVLLAASSTLALDNDKSLPVHVTSNTLTINYKTGTYHFMGNAIAIEGSSELTGNEIVTYSGDDNKVNKIVAIGNDFEQASYKTTPSPNQHQLHSTADIIQFFTTDQIAILEGDALASQGSNHFEGPNLIYNLKAQEIRNSPGSQSKSTVIFTPAQ